MLKWTKDKFKEEYIAHAGADIKCPKCNVWYSESSLLGKNKIEDAKYGFIFTCGQCGHESNWNTEAFPFPALSDENWELKLEHYKSNTETLKQ